MTVRPDSKHIIFIVHFHMFRVSSLCAGVHFFTTVLSCCMWFVFTSCLLPVFMISKPAVFALNANVLFLFVCFFFESVVFYTAMLMSNQPPHAGLSLTVSIALFGTMLYPPCAISVCLCVPFRVCVDIFPDSALVPPEVFKPPDWISQI